MSKLNHSDFQSIQEVMSEIRLNVNTSAVDEEKVKQIWTECVGSKISELASPHSLTEDGVLTIDCKNSLVANELHIERNNLLQMMRENFGNLGIEIKCLKIITGKTIRG